VHDDERAASGRPFGFIHWIDPGFLITMTEREKNGEMKGLSYIIGLSALAVWGLAQVGAESPVCVGTRVLFTGATTFGAQIACGFDALGVAIQQGHTGTTSATVATAQEAPAPSFRPAYVAPALATTSPATAPANDDELLPARPAAQPIVCSWVYDAQKCRTLDQWREQARTWCDRAAQSTARRQAMQRAGYGTNRLFLTPAGAEFAREGQAEATAGAICAAEQGGAAKAQAQTTQSTEH
jgi:hypothetical protein